MRFIPDGPSIPDALLNARDEGRVVFFCGAGVSRARAGLPDFFGLAEAVLGNLGAADDCDARKVLNKARKIGDELGVTGLISADRIFGLLERSFTPLDIQGAVAQCLTTSASPDLSAHLLLLRLARPPAVRTQLVTTNFDRLFEKCDTNLPVHLPPRLPSPSRYDDLNGIVYLHGRVNDDYTGADGDGLVLSSSDFGRAYLSEGWATEFVRDVVRGYVVVFVGYSADDPPIHYLLEGLQKKSGQSQQLYSFQSKDSGDSLARWEHKGVQAIPYANTDDHSALWQTLECWASRADDPLAWRQSILDLAMDGPEKLQPHQRGQVAHIVSTYEGAHDLAERVPPADWLCVFDPRHRYASPARSDYSDPDSALADPFMLYGLDGDAMPQRRDSTTHSRANSPPDNSWDAFAVNEVDRQNLSDENLPALRGHNSTHAARLPKRLSCLVSWIASIADQPATVWWVARQQSLHPGLYREIERQLERRHGDVHPVIRKAWRYLLEARKNVEEPQLEWHDLKRDIDREGWNPGVVRQFATICRPRLTAGAALFLKPSPPKLSEDLRPWNLVRFEVVWDIAPPDIDVPDEWLDRVIRELRKNMELAVQLCDEVGDTSHRHVSPIVPDQDPAISKFARTEGLSGFVTRFASLFERLVELDDAKAKSEFLAWPIDDETIFSRLRFWAAGKTVLATPAEFAAIIIGMADRAFWSHYDQRDLLVVLAGRWAELPDESRGHIEQRLLSGPSRFASEADDEYNKRKAWATLQRLQWLTDNGCVFSGDVKAAIAEIREATPEWQPAYARRAAESCETRGGLVATNKDDSALLCEPIDRILPTAQALSGRTEGNMLEESNPFAGLCENRPVRAFLALKRAARNGDYPEWAWRTFLSSAHREKDMPRLSAAIGGRVCRFPNEVLAGLLHPSTSWLQTAAKPLSRGNPSVFEAVTSRFTKFLRGHPTEGASASSGRDWVTDALNSPAGHIALALLNHSELESIDGKLGLPARWLAQSAELLALGGHPRRHAIAIMALHLDWLYRREPDWTESHLLSALDGGDHEDCEALLAGVFGNPQIRSPKLYERLKPSLLTYVKQASARRTHLQALAHLMLLGLIEVDGKPKQRLLSNAELRDALLHGGDEFRSHVLWQLQRALTTKDGADHNQWLARSLEFFRDVWPRERAAKNAVMSARLCDLLLSNAECFSQLVDIVLPLLTKIPRAVDVHWHLRSDVAEIIDNHAERFVALLYAVLSDDVSGWPYGVGDIIERLSAADKKLLLDARLQELLRKLRSK